MLAHASTPDVLKDSIVPTITILGKDPIPNIRFNVAKSLETMIPVLRKQNLSPLIDEIVKPLLVKMKDDTDADVRYFALKALLVC